MLKSNALYVVATPLSLLEQSSALQASNVDQHRFHDDNGVIRFEKTYFDALVEVYIPVPNLPVGVLAANLPISNEPRMTEHSEHPGITQGVVWPVSPR